MPDLTADPNPNPLAKPVAQTEAQPDAPERKEADSGRPGPLNPNGGRGPVAMPTRAERSVEGTDDITAETLDRSDTAVAERVRDDTILAQGIPGPAFRPEAGPHTAHAGPREAAAHDEADAGGAGRGGPRVAMLVGGPRHGYQTRVEPGATSLTADSGGVRHEYRAGANLPHDFATAMPAQNTPLVYFGYYGPDAEMVKQLREQYPDHGPTLPGGGPLPPHGSKPAVAVDDK
jgi:hypothetical protein